MARENGIELAEEQAKVYFDRLNAGDELSDEELANVGGCLRNKYSYIENDGSC